MSFPKPLSCGTVLPAVLFVLLACNTALYWVSGSLSESIDATAWLSLLASFEFEARGGSRCAPCAAAVRGMRPLAGAAIVAAAVGYAGEADWLDMANTLLWITVAVLLELEVRHAQAMQRYRPWPGRAAALLYALLGALVLVWAWREEWFDAYDAALWLAAFGTIEMDVLRLVRRDAPTQPG